MYCIKNNSWKVHMHVKSHTNVAFDWTYHFLTCEKTLFAILIGRVFFFHMWKTLFAPLISKNQLAHENVQCSFSQYIYNKQLWKIFTRTYKQNDHQYPSVLFYMKWITYRTLLNKLLRPGSISLEWPYNIFSTVIIMG